MVYMCSGALQCSDGLSNTVSNIIRRLIDNMKLLLVCILLVLFSHFFILFKFYSDIYMSKGTTLPYDVAYRTVRSWRQNSFDWFSRWPWNTLRNRMCVEKEWGKLSAVFLQPIQNRGLYRTEEWFYKEPCFPIQASMTLKNKGMLNTLNI
jgi:hypothetical protein